MSFTVTIAICTWNRAILLRRTLEEMVYLQIPDGVDWEILVVDNGSSDETACVISSFADRLPIRRLFEPRPGKSYAANTALAEVRSELLIWTDDDVIVPPDWLFQYVQAAQELPQADFFAGAIDPWFEIEPPAWISRHLNKLAGVYPVADYGEEVRPLGLADGVFGANMAFRTEVARRFPLNPRLGRIQDELPGGDDTDLVQRATAAGHVGYCLPTARVQHFVPAERLTMAYVWKWYRGSGHAFVRRYGLPKCTYFFDSPRWAIWGYLKARLQLWLRRPFRDEAWLLAFIDAARLKGVIQEARVSRKETLHGQYLAGSQAHSVHEFNSSRAEG